MSNDIIQAGDEMARILKISSNAPVEQWATEPEIDRALKEWEAAKEAVAEKETVETADDLRDALAVEEWPYLAGMGKVIYGSSSGLGRGNTTSSRHHRHKSRSVQARHHNRKSVATERGCGVKERPKNFKAHEIRAILDGRKTQFREIAKPQPPRGLYHLELYPDGVWRDEEVTLGKCPYGFVGDRLWVREAWMAYPVHEVDSGVFEPGDPYPTIPKTKPKNACVEYLADWESDAAEKWRPSIHMPRWASRITLEITGVRVERLQDRNDWVWVVEFKRVKGGAK